MYKQIVVGTDGSKSAKAAVDAAIELAKLTGATLHVVHAHKVKVAGASQMGAGADIGIMPVDIVEANAVVHDEGLRICQTVIDVAKGVGVRAEAHCIGGGPADALVRVAGDTHADLIVVGNRGMTGARRFVLGSVPNKVAHSSPTSILIVDTQEARP